MWRRARSPSGESQSRFDLAAVIDDEIEFRRWYDAAAPRVYRYLLSRTGSVSLAEELTQETFIEVVRNPQSFDGRSDPIPWLIGVARHRLFRALRRHRQEEARATHLILDLEVEDQSASSRQLEERESLSAALERLPRDQRAALMLRFVDGRSVKEVAAAIGRSEDATESLIRRARQTFEASYRGADRAS